MKKILKLVKAKLCKQKKYDKKAYEKLTKQTIEEYENGLKKGMSKEESLEEMNKIIDLEINQLKKKPNFLFLMSISLLALFISSLESILLAFNATSYIEVEFVLVTVVWFGIFLYALIFKKNKTKWNIAILILLLSWVGSFIFLELSFLKCRYTSFETSVWEYIFPCVFKVSRYLIDENRTIVPNLAPRSVLYNVYLNWITSLVMSVGAVSLYIKELLSLKKK